MSLEDYPSPSALSSSSTAGQPSNGQVNGSTSLQNSADLSTTDTSSDDHYSSQPPPHPRARRGSLVSTVASRRLSFTTANSNYSNRPRLDVAELPRDETSSEDSDDEGAALGLGLSPPSKPHKTRRHTIVTPFSRPPSTVTSFGGPSRPGSAAVDSMRSRDRLTPSVGPQRRATPSSSKLAAMPPSPPEWAEGSRDQELGRASRGEEQLLASGRDVKGKGKDRETDHSRVYEMPVTDDPFDPLSSMSHGPASNAEREGPRRLGRNATKKQHTAHRTSLQPATTRAPPEPPSCAAPPSATSYPSSDSLASTSRVTISSNGRSNPSSSSSAPPSSAPQPSLQQLLQSVDLTAALRVVQELQTRQQAPPPVSVAPHPPTFSSLPTAPSYTTFPPISPPAHALPSRQAPRHDLPTSSSHTPLSPSADTTCPTTPIDAAEGLAVPGPSAEEKKERRRSLSLGFGVGGKSKRARTFSTISASPSQREGVIGGLASVKERVPDERAVMTEAARSFEEQISRVHLSLSPATLRRAQNCAKYLSLRYTPVYSALSSNTSPPNPVDVARWRQEKEELERRTRRVKVGGTTGVGRLGKVNGVSTANASRDDLGMATDVEGTARGRPSDAGSATSTGSPAVGQLSAYGPRRNKYPKVWEVYPDELAEYVAKGGKVEEAAELGGASLKGGISSWSKAPSRISEDIKLATNSSSAQSPTHWNGSPILGASPLSVDRSHLFSGNSKGSSTLNRPDYSRQNSFEAAHLSRSGTTTTSVDFSGSSSLKRASSTTSAAGGLASAAGLVTAFTKVGDGSAVGNGYGSPRSRVASARGSRDFISSPTSNLDPSSPRILTSSQSPLLHSSPGQSTSASKPSPSTAVAGPPGVRSGISRRLDRIRGKTNSGAAEGGDTSDDRGAPPMSRRGSADYASPDPSDIEGHHRSPQSQPHRLRSPQRGSLAHLSDTGGSRRPNLRKNASSYDFSRGFDTDGYKSSGGEETSRRRPSRGIFSTAWQGFKGSLDVYGNDDPMPFGAKGTPAAAAAAAAKIAEMSPVGPVRRRIVLDESDEEEVKPQREVLDLGDEEFAQLNSSLRQLRTQLAHVDTLLPRVPGLLNFFLDEITSHETSTKEEFGLSVDYAFPRLPASVIAELASAKSSKHPHSTHYSTSDSSSSSESTSSESTSSEDSDDELPNVSSSPRRRRLPRQQSHKMHSRHVTDQMIARQPAGRPRSHTTAFAFNSNSHPLSSKRSSLSQGNRPDSLDGLEKTIKELEKVTKGIDEEARKVQARQEQVDAEITKVVAAVDEAQRSIDETGFQRLRMLEDHYFRLRTSLTRPSSYIDSLWALLAGTLTVIFTFSRLVVGIFRFLKRVLLFPLSAIRWLFFLR